MKKRVVWVSRRLVTSMRAILPYRENWVSSQKAIAALK
jgi:hypothetical protein